MIKAARWALPPLVLLAACSEEPAQTEAETELPVENEAVEPPVARTAITLGQFESEVTDLASWEAQSFGFQGLIYAANGEAGIAAIRPDGAGATMIEPENEPFRVAVAYAFGRGGTLLSLSEDGTLELFSPDGTERFGSYDIAEGGVRDLCVLEDRAAVLTADDQILLVTLGAEADEVSEASEEVVVSEPVDAPGFFRCQATTEAFYFQGRDGWAELAGTGLEDTGIDAENTVLVGVGDDLVPLSVRGAEAGLRSGETLVLTKDDEGTILRPRMVEAAYGNFGGVLRSGALIVLDEERGLHLIPWSTVANAIGAEADLPSRRLDAVAESTGFELGSELEITRERDLPRFQERELPQPPSDQE